MDRSPAPVLRSRGHRLDASNLTCGGLRESDPATDDLELRARIATDGYLFLRSLLDRADVLAARRDILAHLAAEGTVRADKDNALPGPRASSGVRDDIARASAPLRRVLYGGRMAALYQRLFGDDVGHFDFTWLRAVPPGPGTAPHGDSVFMNRGTTRVLTAWVPLGDVDYSLGGLIILAGSHRLDDIRRDYGSRDVDTYCINDDTDSTPSWDGSLTNNPVELQRRVGLRWLTAHFRAGDVVTFPLHTLHASLDNTSSQVRLSCDIRYQPASEPVDPRWVGPNPTGHGSASKRGLIC